MLHRSLGGQQEAEHIDVKVLVEVFGGDAVERRELVDAGVVDEDVDRAELLLGAVQELLQPRLERSDVHYRFVIDMAGFGAGA